MPKTDEDLLIDDAISQRKYHKRGYNLLATLSVAAIFAAIGWFLLFWLRPLVKSVWFLPLGSVTTGLLIIGIIAFAIAGLLVVGALFATNPFARWGDAFPGKCPLCGKRSLRQDKVEHMWGSKDGAPDLENRVPKGIVTLCETPGCLYATATVTTPGKFRAT